MNKWIKKYDRKDLMNTRVFRDPHTKQQAIATEVFELEKKERLGQLGGDSGSYTSFAFSLHDLRQKSLA